MINYLKEIFAALLLFWPSLLFLIFISFIGIIFISIFIGGTLLITSIFTYGIYASLRDFGLLEYLFLYFNKYKNIISNKIHENIRKSFLIRAFTQKSNENEPILYICSPHGLYGFSWFIHFGTNFSDWTLPKPIIAIHSIFFKIPFVKELLLFWNNCIEATEDEITRTLKEGKSVAIIIGGIQELLLSQNDILKLYISKRKGYARIASSLGIPIIPLITIGENELFPFINSPFLTYFQNIIYNLTGLAIPIPSFNSIINWLSIINKPLTNPLKTYILEKINTVNIDENSIRDTVINNIKQFSLKHKLNIEII